MIYAVIILGVIVAVLVILVAGLLRSHALMLRTLNDAGIDLSGFGTQTQTATPLAEMREPTDPPVIPGDAPIGRPAHDVVGATPDGGAAAIAVRGVEHDTVLLFLSSDCATCRRFWDALATDAGPLALPVGARLVAVTKGVTDESPAAVAAHVATVPVVMSNEAWVDHDVPGSPYAVHVDGPSGRVIGEGTGGSWPQLADLLARAAHESGHESGHNTGRQTRWTPGSRRAVADKDADSALLAAGIRPGDPSLDRRRTPS